MEMASIRLTRLLILNMRLEHLMLIWLLGADSYPLKRPSYRHLLADSVCGY